MDKKKQVIFVIFLIGLIITSFFIRLIPIRLAHFWDETVYLQHAEMMFSGRTNFDELSFRPPLLSILFYLAFFIKHSVISASVVTALFGATISLFIFLIGRKIYNNEIGIMSALVFAFTPFLTLNSNYLLTDVPVIIFMAISFYFILFRERKWFLFLSGMFFSLAILMKFTAILMALVFLFYFIFNKFKFKEILFFGFGALLVILPYFIWCQIQFGNFLIPFIKGPGMVNDKNEGTFFYSSNLVKAFGIFVFIGIFLWIVNFFSDLKNKKYKIMKLDLVLVFWIFIFLVYLTKTPHKELRYILPITIPIILIASKGFWFFVTKMRRYEFWFWFGFGVYLIFMISNTYAFDSLQNGVIIDRTISDEMRIADYLRDIGYEGIIYSNQRWPVLAYYTGLEVRLLWPQDEKIYLDIPHLMKDSGIIIGMFGVKEPQPMWLDDDSRFTNYREIGDFFIYDYSP